MGDTSKEYLEILHRYERKSEINRQVHSDLASKYKKYNSWLAFLGIALSAAVTFLAFIDVNKVIDFLGIAQLNADPGYIDSIFNFFLALFGLILFIISLLNSIFGLQETYAKHESGVKLLTDLITDIKDICELLENNALSKEVAENKIKEINDSYSLIGQVLPITPDQDFLNSKRNYLLKRRISERMDKDCCINVNLNKYSKDCDKNAFDETK